MIILQYRSKVTYHRLARRVSNETRRVSRETRRVSFLASALEVPKLRIYRYSKPVFMLFYTYSGRIFIAVDTSFHCRQRCMCTMCVLLKSSTVHQYCFIHVYIGQTFFKVRHVGVCRLTCCQCRDCAHKMSTQQHTPTLEHAKPRFSHLTKFLFKLEHSLRT